MAPIFNFFGGRKYFALFVILVIGLFMAYKQMLEMELVYLMLAAYGLYCGGNVGSKFSLGRLTIDTKRKK